MDGDCRKLLEYATGCVISGVVYDVMKYYSFLTATGIETTILRDVIKPKKTVNTKLFDRYLNIENIIQVYPGEGNILAAALKGKYEISRYINSASNSFAGFFPKRDDYIKVLRDHPNLKLSDEHDILHLGGPVANILGGKATGYKYDLLENNKPFPTLIETTKLRWGFDVGEHDFGDRGTTLRNEDGETRPKPRYALVDTTEVNKLRFPKVDEQGRSIEDWLLITKRPNFNSLSSKNILSIGGMHGHSLEKFAEHLYLSFKKLESIISFSATEYFQILLPCRLIHTIELAGGQNTKAVILWDDLKYQAL